MLPQWIIEKKRNGETLSDSEIDWFVAGYTKEDIPSYQMSALAMAIYFQGMSFEEVTALTNAMMNSGKLVDTSSVQGIKVDKHSTGGIGDKVSLIIAPLVACFGVAVPMLSGRGLGITGGTLDKLESIPGYRTSLSVSEFLAVLNKCGCSIMGQTSELAPADKKLYALRDVTGTVPSIPLISASIMSKKLAEGSDALVLDVKWGKGAFMKTKDDARTLAKTMVEIGKRMGRGMTAVLTDMNQPLGNTAGNALEVVESINTLRGHGPADLVEVTMELAANMLILGSKATDREDALEKLEDKLESGAAFDKFKEMVLLHGGDVSVLDDPSLLSQSKTTTDVLSDSSGYVAEVNAELIGKACIVLGAGRREVADEVDHAVGLSNIVKNEQRVEKGTVLATIHVNDDAKLKETQQLLSEAFVITEEFQHVEPLIVETIV